MTYPVTIPYAIGARTLDCVATAPFPVGPDTVVDFVTDQLAGEMSRAEVDAMDWAAVELVIMAALRRALGTRCSGELRPEMETR